MVIQQYDIFIVILDTTVGAEIRKARPCVVISPDEMNKALKTVQIAPMTTNTEGYPWRVPTTFQGRKGMVALDHIRTVDRKRLAKRVGHTGRSVTGHIKRVIHEMLVA